MKNEDLEIKIPQSDLKFLNDHGFHPEEESWNKMKIMPKTVYLEMSDEYLETLEFLIVLKSSIGSYYTVKHCIQKHCIQSSNQLISQIREFTKRFEVGHLTETFSNFQEEVKEHLAFEEDIISKRILQFCQKALDLNDESKVIGVKSCNIYEIQ